MAIAIRPIPTLYGEDAERFERFCILVTIQVVFLPYDMHPAILNIDSSLWLG